MKKVLVKFLPIGCIALLMLASCKKNDPIVTTKGGTAGTLAANVTTLVLDKAMVSDTTKVVKFSFTKPAYGYSAAVTNTLQIDAPGDNWKNPSSATLGTKTLSQGYTTADFNNLVLKLNLPAGVASKVDVRVQHSLGTGTTPIYSNVVEMTVTPFNLTSWVYVVGTFNGYSTNTADSLISVTGNGIYTGIINFTDANDRFLILPAKNFNTKYATTESPNTKVPSLTYSTEFVSSGGSDLYAPAVAGQYFITLNANANTISIEPVNTYSVIGSVTPGGDFSTDLDLKFVNSADQDWEGVFAFTNGSFPGSFKVRQNHDWSLSWGVPKAGSDGEGIANTLNNTTNDNVPITSSGNYKVTFSIPITTVGTAPAKLATYTVAKQ